MYIYEWALVCAFIYYVYVLINVRKVLIINTDNEVWYGTEPGGLRTCFGVWILILLCLFLFTTTHARARIHFWQAAALVDDVKFIFTLSFCLIIVKSYIREIIMKIIHNCIKTRKFFLIPLYKTCTTSYRTRWSFFTFLIFLTVQNLLAVSRWCISLWINFNSIYKKPDDVFFSIDLFYFLIHRIELNYLNLRNKVQVEDQPIYLNIWR